MCVVSMIHDHFRDRYPLPDYLRDLDDGWIKIRWEEYQELLRKAREYDARTNQPNCEDPKKAEFEKQVKATLIRKGVLHG